MLANRVKKRFKHLRKQFTRQHIEVFRLYDWEIPEVWAVVDWYAGHLVIGEYTREQSTPEGLPMMGAAIFFSTNHQGFEPRMAGLKVSGIEEITDQTIPEDYVNKRKRIHRCWRIFV